VHNPRKHPESKKPHLEQKKILSVHHLLPNLSTLQLEKTNQKHQNLSLKALTELTNYIN
jgi:hypothetical protein